MDIIEVIGWIGGVLLATCGVPQLIHTYKVKTTEGLSKLFIWWWITAEILLLIYVISVAPNKPVVFNLAVNIVICIMLLLAFILYKDDKKSKEDQHEKRKNF